MSAVLIHHDGKADGDGQTSSRGSSVIEDVPESLGHLSCTNCHDGKVGDKPPVVTITWRLRNNAPVPPLVMQFDGAIGLFIPKLSPSQANIPPGAKQTEQAAKHGITEVERTSIGLKPEDEATRDERESIERAQAKRPPATEWKKSKVSA